MINQYEQKYFSQISDNMMNIGNKMNYATKFVASSDQM